MKATTKTPEPIVISSTLAEDGAIPLVRVHHRDWPEIHAEGESVETAARNLILQFQKNADSSTDRWKCEAFETAMEEVRSFESKCS
ncbi:MAG: hypothetical protein ABSE84_10385 [Isosphaeraceae bacterium]|jgi:hypothetical protein